MPKLLNLYQFSAFQLKLPIYLIKHYLNEFEQYFSTDNFNHLQLFSILRNLSSKKMAPLVFERAMYSGQHTFFDDSFVNVL